MIASSLFDLRPTRFRVPIDAFDATTIDLCLALFPWARFRRTKAAVKLHALLDLRGPLPTVVVITDGKAADVTLLDALAFEPGAFYILDRGYTDFARLYRLTEALAFFVIRGKRGFDYVRRVSRPVDKTTGLRSDQTIVLCGLKTATLYPVPLRRITYVDPDTQRRFVFLTNNFALPALQIAQLYKCRWQVELFFKWIKQHLRIKAFYGTSRERGQDPGLDRPQRVRPGGDPQEGLGLPHSLYTSPNAQRDPIRENANLSSPRASPRPDAEGEAS